MTLPAACADIEKAVEAIEIAARSNYEQFPGIHRRAPSIEGRFTTASGKLYLRYKFLIWSGRGGPIETSFKQELLDTLHRIEPEYPEWKIAIGYEVDNHPGRGVY